MQETWAQALGQGDLLEKEMVIHSNILAGKSHDREPDGLQSTGLQKFIHELETKQQYM